MLDPAGNRGQEAAKVGVVAVQVWEQCADQGDQGLGRRRRVGGSNASAEVGGMGGDKMGRRKYLPPAMIAWKRDLAAEEFPIALVESAGQADGHPCPGQPPRHH